jgi:transposase-like protein
MSLLKTGIVQRRRLTSPERQRLLARYHKGQFTQKEFAAREGIGLSTLIKWLQQERTTGQPSVDFQEVVLPGAVGRWAMEVASPQGWTLRLQTTAGAVILASLLRTLPC